MLLNTHYFEMSDHINYLIQKNMEMKLNILAETQDKKLSLIDDKWVIFNMFWPYFY